MTPGEHFVENRPQRCLEALSSREQAELSEKVCIVRGAGETKKLQDIAPPTLIKPLIPEGRGQFLVGGLREPSFERILCFRVEPSVKFPAQGVFSQIQIGKSGILVRHSERILLDQVAELAERVG